LNARVHEIIHLSEVTGVDLYQCFKTGGYDLEDIPRLQTAILRRHTAPLPTTIYDRARLIEWPGPLADGVDPRRGEFVSELVSGVESRRASDVQAACAQQTRYFRVGTADRHLSPDIVPGTIVGVDVRDRGPADAPIRTRTASARPLYVVAHLRGLTCTYVDWIGDGRIALVPRTHHRRPVLYTLDDEAVVIGRVREELRPLKVEASDAPGAGHDHPAPRLVFPDADRQTFGRFLRSARESIGLTHREAHEISAKVADTYRDRQYAIGVGTLSDWESQDEPPRHLPHLISLAVCYAVSFGQLMRAARLVDRDPFELPLSGHAATSARAVLDGLSALPPALVHAARIASELPGLSWNDVFRCGRNAAVFDRSVSGASYLIVDRRIRRLPGVREPETIDRPLYILGDSRGRQICSGCFEADGHIYIQPDPSLPLSVKRLPRGHVSIRGRVVAALRVR
jgi:hypothetical protein